LAIQILASDRPALLDQVLEYRRQLTADVMAKQEQLADLGVPEYLRRFY
jgi:5-(carboxyamino)imidazole ribonucleotide mutase